jgi:endo-1,4-beta-mannosidase/plastocyanin
LGPFIRTDGTRFTLDNKTWYLYGGATYGTSNPGGSQSIADEIALAQAGGLNTLRIVNMFDESGVTSGAPRDEASWQRVDQFLAALKAAGLHAILDLSAFRNHLQNRELYLRGTAALPLYPVPAACSTLTGDDQTRCVGAHWCEGNPGSCTNPYSADAMPKWNDFLEFVTTRTNTVTGVEYRDDPTIAIVSFAGEPNPPNSQEPLRPGTQELTDFYSHVFAQWKAYDGNHLVTTGGLLHIDWQALYGSDSGIDTDAIFSLPQQDVLSIHNYFATFPATASTDTKTSIVAQAAQDVHKPWITEEFGFPQQPSSGGTNYTEADRGDWFRNVYDIQRAPAQGVPSAGVAFWNLGPQVSGGSHDVNPGTPATWAAVQEYAPVPHPVHTFVIDADTDGADASLDGICDDGGGRCTLRAAIAEANGSAGLDELDFAIPSGHVGGDATIQVQSDLPVITGPVMIEGQSQPGSATPNVILDGSMSTGSEGLVLAAGAATSSVDGLVISGFDAAGIDIRADDASVTGSFIGTDLTGTHARPNGLGVLVDAARRVSIGSYTDGSGNVISGNVMQGVKIQGGPGVPLFTSIRGNRIGTDATGTIGLGNGAQGVLATGEGVDLGGNFSEPPFNVTPGGPCTGACNLISANGAPAGVELAKSSLVRGNYIGTDVTGTHALGNAVAGVIAHDGVQLGSVVPEGRNIISGNGVVGLRITGRQNGLLGSFIGTDTTGMHAIPNGDGSAAAAGVELCCSTYITNIGGSSSYPTRNVISGNDGTGVLIHGPNTTSNFMELNYVGVGADGQTPVPNDVGVRITDGAYRNVIGQLSSYPFISNVIASNTGDGIQIENAHDDRIWSNKVVDNGGYGLLVDNSSFSMIGGNGQYRGGDNTIARNGRDGVAVLSGTNNSIFRNAIFDNAGLGIDLADDGVTPNDPGDGDGGPNGRQNTPELTFAGSSGETTTVQGHLSGAPTQQYLVEFFSDTSCDPSGSGEGRIFLGSKTVTTGGSGSASFSAILHSSVSVGNVVTATATRGDVINEFVPLEGTSEFSACETVVAAPPPIAITNVTPASTSVGLYEPFEAAFDLDRTYNNPFDPSEIEVNVTFTSPTGKVATIPAFWYQDFTASTDPDGDNEGYTALGTPTWMVRFAPTETGTYSYTIEAQDSTGTGSSGTSTFESTASSNRGFVRLDRNDSRYMRYDDGTPYIPRGHNAAFGDRKPFQGGLSVIRPLFDSFATARENWTRVWMADFDRSAIEWGSNHWSGLYDGPGVYSLPSAWRMDKVLERAGSDGLEVQLVLDDHGQFSNPGSNTRWDENPYNAANGGPVPSDHPEQFFTLPAAKALFKQRLRYMVARWGAYPQLLCWELFNEIQFLGSSASNPLNDPQMAADVQAWHIEMATYLKSIDPFKHLVTTSSDAPNVTEPIWSDPHIDLVQVHDYGGPPMARFAETIRQLRNTYDKPVIYGEFGLNGNPEAGFDPTTFSGSTANRHHLERGTALRNAVWASALAGSGAMSWWWGTYVAADPDRHRTAPNFPLNERIFPALDAYLGNLDIVALGLHGSNLTPSSHLAAVGMDNSNRAFAWVQDVDSEYGSGVDPANAIVTGGSVDIAGMQDGDYTVDIYSTSGPGGVQSSFTASASGGSLHIELPPVVGDLALKARPGPPRSPTDVVAAAGDGQATVAWTAPTSGAPGSITGYTVTPRDETLGSDLPVVQVTGTEFTMSGLTNDHAYTFAVAAVNAVGPSEVATSFEVTPRAGAPAPEVVSEAVGPSGGSVSTGGIPTSTDPVTTEVEVPSGAGGGQVTIGEGTVSQDPPVGLQFLSTQIHIDSTATTTASNPLRVTFSLDALALQGESITTLKVYRTEGNGPPTLVPDCTADPTALAAPDPCIPFSSRRPLSSGSGGRFTVVTSSASEWNFAFAAPKAVSVTDAGCAPRSTTLAMGQRVEWTFSSIKSHSVTESTGLGTNKAALFDSGLRTSGSLEYRFRAAGVYTYRSTNKKDGTAFAGTVTVPMSASPVSGTHSTSFSLALSSGSISGYAFDVQVRFRKQGSSKWSGWAALPSTTSPGTTFVPTKGAGTYAFHSRMRNATTSRATAWSPDVTITVTS